MRLLNPATWRRAKTRRPARASGAARRHRTRRAPDWRLRRRVALGMIVLAAASGLGWSWQSGWIGRQIARAGDAVLAATARAGLKVDDVLVEGRARTRRSAILDSLGVARDVPILGVDAHAARRRLEALPWVRTATVERRLPQVIYVRLVERKPLALWQNGGRLAVIDRAGAVIPGARAEAFAQLPVVVGKDAPSHAAELLAMLESEPGLKALVAAAVRVHGRRWNVRLDGGIDVRLPESDPAGAWAQLARIEREHGVLGRDVVTIDLRMADRLIVRTAPGVTLPGVTLPGVTLPGVTLKDGRTPAGEET